MRYLSIICETLKEMPKPYLLLAILRVVLTCLPQIGYIHPDEFFQSIEVVAGKLFNVEAKTPWEFTPSFPIRSITLPYLTVGMSFQVLKNLDYFLGQHFKISILNPYYVLIFPRLLFCFLSFLIDWCLYKICITNNEKCKSRCLVLSVSYVMVVYATRTFSNTIELVLFSLLLYYVAESIIFSTITVKQREYINARYRTAGTIAEKAKFHKLRLFLENDTLRNSFIVSTITAAGFFNRPTFIFYAVGPIFFWLYRGIGFKSVPPLQFHLRTVVFLLGMIPTIILFIIIDSFYFGHLTWGEIGVLELSINNFVVTPLNFIKHNIDSSNLALHGLHPRYLHILLNIPLLFSILAVLAYSDIVNLASKLIQGRYHYLPSIRSMRGLMLTSFVVPVLMLSIFPHQEPRFLIPLVLPLIYLYGSKMLPESDDIIVKSYISPEGLRILKKVHTSYTLFKTWIAINVILTIFYGFLHQGGIFSFISYLNNEIKISNHDDNYQIVTSHIYSIPKSLLMQKINPYTEPYNAAKQLTIHEEGSTSLDKVLTKISTLLNICTKNNFQYSDCKLYLILPTSLMDKLYYTLSNNDSNLILNDTFTFYPHISTEAVPDIMCIHHDNCLNIITYPMKSIMKIFRSMGLSSIQFILKNHVN